MPLRLARLYSEEIRRGVLKYSGGSCYSLVNVPEIQFRWRFLISTREGCWSIFPLLQSPNFFLAGFIPQTSFSRIRTWLPASRLVPTRLSILSCGFTRLRIVIRRTQAKREARAMCCPQPPSYSLTATRFHLIHVITRRRLNTRITRSRESFACTV